MNDVLPSLEKWLQRGDQVAVATVINTWGSAPRPVGSKMIVTRSGAVAGSVSAGCVENAVIEECQAALKTGQPRLLTYGVADDTAFEVGLTCGGTIEVFAEPFSAWDGIYQPLRQGLDARAPMAVVSVLKGTPERLNHKLLVLADGSTQGDLLIPGLEQWLVETALEQLARGVGDTRELEDGTLLFFEVYPPVPRLILIGAVHIAEVLVPMANLVGFDTIVVDPRGVFATRERFPAASQLIKKWPQEVLPEMALDNSAYVVTLTHDPKLDDPALMIALPSRARYVGALGSRRTTQKRAERLREAGLSEEHLARLHAPVGLPLGGRTTAEIALSILAEVVQAKNGALERVPQG